MNELKMSSSARKYTVIALAAVFLLAELALYPIIQTVSAKSFGIPTYISVILAFVFSFVCYLTERERYSFLVNTALAFTLGADFCLVVLTPARETAGVVIFIGAQLAYFLYVLLREKSRALIPIHIAVRAALTLLAPTAVYFILDGKPDALSVVSVIYYVQLVLNLAFSLFDRDLRLFSAGLFLFSLCDLSIGLKNLSGYFAVSGGFFEFLKTTDLNLAWIFYLPSQVLISLSLVKWKSLFKKP